MPLSPFACFFSTIALALTKRNPLTTILQTLLCKPQLQQQQQPPCCRHSRQCAQLRLFFCVPPLGHAHSMPTGAPIAPLQGVPSRASGSAACARHGRVRPAHRAAACRRPCVKAASSPRTRGPRAADQRRGRRRSTRSTALWCSIRRRRSVQHLESTHRIRCKRTREATAYRSRGRDGGGRPEGRLFQRLDPRAPLGPRPAHGAGSCQITSWIERKDAALYGVCTRQDRIH
jgi:hypothetical protein